MSDFINIKDRFQKWQVKFELMMRVTVLNDDGDSEISIDMIMVTAS